MGSVHAYDSATGKRYRVLYRKPDHGQGQKRGFKTKRDAELFLASVEVSKAKGEFVDASAARSTVDALGVEWLKNQTHLKPSSFRPVEIAWRLYVRPEWGKRAVGDIRHSQVQAWVSQISADRGATTVLRAYGVLASILDAALEDRRISANPARGVNLPRKTGKKRVYLSHAQVQALADNAKDRGTLIFFLAYTGLRWGEATGLRVRDLDALRRRVVVNENAVNVGGRIIVGTPKSHTARSVPYPAFLSEPLARECEGKDRAALLFGNGVDHVRLPDSRRGWFVGAVVKSQTADKTFERVTVHDLRHTAASLSISAGANVKAVQRMLGHASAAMTLDTYADLFEDDLDDVATALDQARTSASVANLLPNGDIGKRKTP
ncbi:site-specific recombinase XerD [Rhodoglobus vestalii]|uniref:Site-specific recombinase XerD n=1 Tax=Rhodoglobus vestalii TaxID=193384 RepID=A0A8H2PYF9_9MICO|nr:tyrosine-type recombinase/integrase [Rhodoglobus vestalii]TQO20319.1 site-specific recombinase XerD [Rhodoglobus vestalii]